MAFTFSIRRSQAVDSSTVATVSVILAALNLVEVFPARADGDSAVRGVAAERVLEEKAAAAAITTSSDVVKRAAAEVPP